MEYLVIVLILALIAVFFIKQPNKVTSVIIGAVIERLRTMEAEIVKGLYNKLPIKIKEVVDSKMLAEIVGFTIGIVIDILDGND